MRIEHVLDCPRGKIGPQCLISCEHDLQSNAECHNITVCNIDGCTCPLGFLGQSCSERVEKANLLTVTSINKTSIRVSLPVTWDYNYERTAICYSFNIKGQGYSHQQSWKRIFKNTRQLIGHFENLTPDTAYKIRCSIQFPEYKVHSDWIIVSTNCNPVEGFDIFFKETSTLIDWRVTTSFEWNNECPNNY
ncbi:unnamed protein product [Lasius platythorax]|uniref:EGF-like domain-containing protein n=1 Tax=Lasius platythorax TaxID=488582 RepID=A0AAV2NKY7_9HYME